MKNDLTEKFDKLCGKAMESWHHNTYGTKELEPSLLEILNFTKANAKYRNQFVKKFVNILTDYEYGPLEIVIFCMRELQWREIKEAAHNIQVTQDDLKLKIAMQDVLDVYNEHWEDADLYDYYSKKL